MKWKESPLLGPFVFSILMIVGGSALFITISREQTITPLEIEGDLIISVETRFLLDGVQWCHIILSNAQVQEWYIENCEFPPNSLIELDRVLLFVGQESDPRI